MGNAFQGVSWQNPLGTNSHTLANQVAAEAGKLSPAQDFQVPSPSRSNPNDPESSLNPNNPNYVNPNPATPITPASPEALTSLAPSTSTTLEDALRNTYQSALSPNYGQTFQGSSGANQFSAVPGVKGGK